MAYYNPKIVIINYFDELINRVDIDIEECLEKYNEGQVLGELECFKSTQERHKPKTNISFKYFDNSLNTSEQNPTDQWSEETKVVDYLNQVRMRTIEELRRAQEESLDYFKNSGLQIDVKNCQIEREDLRIEYIRSKLFDKKFYFQVNLKPSKEKEIKGWIFNLFTLASDFYLSPSDIVILETLINDEFNDEQKFHITVDEKMFFLGSIQNYFIENLKTQKCPSHLIHISKENLCNIEKIVIQSDLNLEVNLSGSSSNFLSKIEQLSIITKSRSIYSLILEDLSSLKSLQLESKFLDLKPTSITNLWALRELILNLVYENFNSNLQTCLFDHLPNIETLSLSGWFYNFNLDSLANLKNLSLSCIILSEDFSWELFKNISNRLEKISISCKFVNRTIKNLFYKYHFPKLIYLEIKNDEITKLEKNFLADRFPSLKSLSISISNNKELIEIDRDAFSSLKNLDRLELSGICFTDTSLDMGLFSELSSLTYLNLSNNQIKRISYSDISRHLSNLKTLDVTSNPLDRLNLSILRRKLYSSRRTELPNFQQLVYDETVYPRLEEDFSDHDHDSII